MKCTFSALIIVSAASLAHPAEPVSISSLAGKAISTNPEVKYYEAEIAAARGGEQSAAAVANPEIETSFGTWRVKELSGGGRSDGPAWAVTLGQAFEWPGRIALRKAIALKQTEIAQLGLDQFKAMLAGKVRSAAWSLLAAQEKARATAETSSRLSALSEVMLQRDAAGPAPRLEARVIQTTALILGTEAAKARRDLAAAKFALNQLLGEKPDHDISVKKEQFELASLPALESLLADARKNNFDLRSRILDVEQQGFSVKLAENERWPAFKVAPYVSQQRAGSRETQFGIGVSIPLPLWNKNKGAVATATARQTQAEMLLAAELRDLERQVATHRSLYQSFVEELAKWPAGTLDGLHKAAAEADEHYRLGALPVSTYIELQQQSIEAANTVLESQFGALEARAEIERLTGTTLSK